MPSIRAASLSIHTGLVCQCCASDTTSKTLTQRQKRRIGAGSLHPNGSVKEAIACGKKLFFSLFVLDLIDLSLFPEDRVENR